MSQINDPEVLQEVTENFLRYEKALTSNDVEVLDQLFSDHETTVRYGVSENLYGYDQIKKFRSERSGKGLDRALNNTKITCFGKNFAIANTEFSRSTEHRIGRQSQTWVRFEDGWKIVAAHVSLMG